MNVLVVRGFAIYTNKLLVITHWSSCQKSSFAFRQNLNMKRSGFVINRNVVITSIITIRCNNLFTRKSLQALLFFLGIVTTCILVFDLPQGPNKPYFLLKYSKEKVCYTLHFHSIEEEGKTLGFSYLFKRFFWFSKKIC